MRAFVSYSTKDKKHGGAIKSVLGELGIDSFLAHDDLQVSEKWKSRILSKLKSCDIFIPLLSQAFKESEWCGQETGIAANRRGILIIPLSIDGTIPYGFISHIQAHRMHSQELERQVLLNAIAKKWPERAVDTLLPTMEKVYTFRQAEAVVALFVPYFSHFTPEQANRFAELAVGNGQIWDAHLCFEKYLPEFLAANKDRKSVV